ncbi:MAG: hypothetical protein O3B65_00130 [Chloroflexi bacterium]|nr:hypothetical protein [Chloroflexota bacterium]
MATIQINIPDTLTADVRTAIERLYGSSVDGFTDKQKIAHHLRKSLMPHVAAIRRQADATLAAVRANRETNNAARAVAQAADEVAVAGAEGFTNAASDAALGGIA